MQYSDVFCVIIIKPKQMISTKRYIYFVAVIMTCLLGITCLSSCLNDDADVDSIKDPVAIDGFVTRRVISDSSMTLVSNKSMLQQIMPDGYMEYSAKVDFSKNNLLLIHDVSNYGVSEIIKDEITSETGFEFDIKVHQNLLCVLEPWCIAYIVPKKFDLQKVKYKIKYLSMEW